MDSGLRTEVLQEFSALRDESLKRTEIRHQLISFTLIAAGTFLTVGAQELAAPVVLLIYPLLATFLAATWTHSDIRVGEIGEYIRKNIEPRLEGLNWEQHLHQMHAKSGNWLQRRLTEIATTGIFISTELLAIILAVCHSNWEFSRETEVLLILDVIAIILTVLFVFRRRKMYRTKK
jgi:hypothetical protein